MHSVRLPSAAPFRTLREERRRQDAEALAAAHALRDAGADAAEVGAAPVVVTPAYDGALAPLPRARRRAFREHLRRVIALAFADDAPIVASIDDVAAGDDAPAVAVLGAACAACGGVCCTRGGDRAFLTADTIRRWRALHPHATPRDARRAWLARLRAESHAGSCVFHGPAGCALPRELRSDTCNRYFCGALAELRRAGSPRAFVAAARDGVVVRAALVDGGGA